MSALEIVGAAALYVGGSVALAYICMWVTLLALPRHWGLVALLIASRVTGAVLLVGAVVGLLLLGRMLP